MENEPVAAWSTRNTPRSIIASPKLNTFAPGHPAGMAKMSPRKATRAPSTTSEFANEPEQEEQEKGQGARPMPADAMRTWLRARVTVD